MTPFPKRLPGLAEEEWTDEVASLLWSTVARTGQLEGALEGAPAEDGPPRRPLPILPVIAQQPRLLAPFLAWASALALEGVLPRRDSELLALRAAHNGHSDFEWSHHRIYALAAGITEAEIARVRVGPDAAGWAAHESALLLAADELHLTTTVGEDTWAALAGHYDPGALVEIVFVVGNYTMLSMLANAAGVVDDEALAGGSPSRGAG